MVLCWLLDAAYAGLHHDFTQDAKACIFERFCGGKSACGVFCDGVVANLLEFDGDLRPVMPEWWEFALDDLHDGFCGFVLCVGVVPDEHFVEEHAKSVDVGLWSGDVGAFEAFWGHVIGCTDEVSFFGHAVVVCILVVGDAKIDEDGASICRKEDIFGFEVAV